MIEKALLIERLEKEMTQRQIANEFGVSQTTLRYWIVKHGLKSKVGKLSSLGDDQLPQLVETSLSFCDVCRKLGLPVNGSVVTRLKKRVIKLGLSTIHFKTGFEVKQLNATLKPVDENVFVISLPTDYIRTYKVKSELLKIVPNKCIKCSNGGEWLGETLTLQMDHINGLRWDNRLENLRILCPNCHSQTPTYGSKNRK